MHPFPWSDSLPLTLLGSRLGAYRVVRRIGEGGMGTVYEGVRARLALFEQVCAAVQHAHRNLAIHRDLKPSNVLVTAERTVKLLDFGVAKVTDPADPGAAGTLTGAGLSPFTAGYAAPEQVERGAVTTATDVYALGALPHVLLTGRAPFDADRLGAVEAVVAIREGRLRPPSELATAARFFQAMAGGGVVEEVAVAPSAGPNATFGEWLDSAATRIAPAFPDDPGVRARLYTAVAGSYLGQARLREALPVVDSALRLTRPTYGARSDAFAEASLVAVGAAVQQGMGAAAERHARAAADSAQRVAATPTMAPLP